MLSPRYTFAISGNIASIFLLFIVSVNVLSLMFCICPFGLMRYSICLILLGSTSSVVVARSLLDLLVMLFTTLSF
ncbi:MAG: hypothetical protein WCH65_01310 [bacterium]